MEKLKTSPDHQEARMLFVDYWAEYVRTHPDWSEQHTRFINALMHSAQSSPLSPQQYLQMKGEPCLR